MDKGAHQVLMEKYKFEFIAGGVVKDADGNIVDDTSEKLAKAKLRELGLSNILDDQKGK